MDRETSSLMMWSPRQRYRYGIPELCVISTYVAYDNMAFGLKLRKVPKDEIDKSVMKLLRFF